MGCGIYKIENKVNGKIYIGSSIEVHVRLMNHKYMLRANKHDNEYLQKSFNKYGEDNFIFSLVELCDIAELIVKENFYIDKFSSNDLKLGYNLAKVNEFRRNNFNNEVKIKNSKINLLKNGNFTKFKALNISDNKEIEFDSLVDAANYLVENSFSKGKLRNIRQKISFCLRNKKVNNGNKGSIRKTAYNHIWAIIT
jgi:group I intron endonuclease